MLTAWAVIGCAATVSEVTTSQHDTERLMCILLYILWLLLLLLLLQEVDEILFDSYTRIEHVITGYWLHALRGINLPIISSLTHWLIHTVVTSVRGPVWGRGNPLPLVHLLPHLFPLYFSPSFIGFTYFLLLPIPSLSTRIVSLRFQAGGRRRRPNLGF